MVLYFMNLLFINKIGENFFWDLDEFYYDDIFIFWDIVCGNWNFIIYLLICDKYCCMILMIYIF